MKRRNGIEPSVRRAIDDGVELRRQDTQAGRDRAMARRERTSVPEARGPPSHRDNRAGRPGVRANGSSSCGRGDEAPRGTDDAIRPAQSMDQEGKLKRTRSGGKGILRNAADFVHAKIRSGHHVTSRVRVQVMRSLCLARKDMPVRGILGDCEFSRDESPRCIEAETG
jgi:hypothetical protein